MGNTKVNRNHHGTWSKHLTVHHSIYRIFSNLIRTLFTVSEGKNQMRIRIPCGLDSRSRAGFWKNDRATVNMCLMPLIPYYMQSPDRRLHLSTETIHTARGNIWIFRHVSRRVCDVEICQFFYLPLFICEN